MKKRLQTTAISLFILSLFISGCASASPTTAPGQATAAGETAAPATEEVVEATATPSPTEGPTATVWPPVYDPDAIGDNRELLDSFILTRTNTTTGGGEVDEVNTTIGYIREPFTAYESNKWSFENLTWWTYLIEGRYYEKNRQDAQFYSLESGPDDIEILQRMADMREFDYLLFSGLVLSAQFVGQEDFAGVPANHFTFDQTNLREESDPTGTYKVDEAQGELYLAQDGNYLLYFHLKRSGSVYLTPGEPGYGPGVLEMTEELSSINELTEITLPADFDLELDFGLPLPAGSTLVGITSYGYNPVYYHYTMPISKDEFPEFYKNLAPTNGFTFSHIGQKTNNIHCDPVYSDYLQDCVFLKKGGSEFILYIAGISGADSIFVRAERDR